MNSVAYALMLTSIAGFATSIGALLGIANKKPKPRYISFIMAFSAGVMIFLSFVEMFNEAQHVLGLQYALICMTAGLGVVLIIDMLLPEQENVHDHLLDNGKNLRKHEVVALANIDPQQGYQLRYGFGHSIINQSPQSHGDGKVSADCNMMFCADNPKVLKLGLMAMLGLIIHNIPEGLATFSATLINPRLGVEIALAIMLHNIPEGICIAVPIYTATQNKKKAFWYATLSGLAEPFGALLAWIFLSRVLTENVLMVMIAMVAGVMTYISIDTLVPTAKTMDYKHTTIIGFTIGMVVIGISLIYL